jgi:hypothetical protein
VAFKPLGFRWHNLPENQKPAQEITMGQGAKNRCLDTEQLS